MIAGEGRGEIHSFSLAIPPIFLYTSGSAFSFLSGMKKFLCFTVLLWGISAVDLLAEKYILRDGREIEGKMALLSRVDEKVDTEQYISRRIVVVDDGLRRVYFSKSQIWRISEEQSSRPVTFRTGQSPNYQGKEYVVPGTYSNSTPFDSFGRRLLKIFHPGGVEHVEQSIVELTPYYVRVTSLRADNQPLNWEMRIATNAIPREIITPIVMRTIDPTKIDDRMSLVRFYYDGGLYVHADAELEFVSLDWKDHPDEQQRIRAMALNVRRQMFQQYLDELELRRDSGQYRLVRQLISELEEDPRLPELLLEPVRRMLRWFDETDNTCREIVTAMRELYEQLPEPDKKEKILTIIADIEKELNFSTLRRLTQFQLYVKDVQLPPAEKLAIGITGWYAGAEVSNSRLGVALMLPDTEKLIAAYLCSGHDFLLRQRILEQLKNLETARPDLIAAILATMKPPFSELPEENPAFPGYYRLTIPNPLLAPGAPRLASAPEIRYCVQLPPDYNPNQRYPMIVSLNGVPQTPDAQIDWWAGSWRNGNRMGHATRHGYIVIAPDWNPQEIRKPEYDFSAFSHAAVVCAVRDAFKRFSVNTDKVFISGHGIGGTAAWDIAQAHPDMWAGAVVFNGVASKYIDTYWETARHIPLYLVWGEMEGVGNRRKWEVNTTVMNRHLLTQARPADVTAIRYIGRGMESFSEEILNALEWMNVKQRNAVPSEFEVKTMRPWDLFFWWVEMPNLLGDRPANMVDPVDFAARRNALPVKVQSRLNRGTNAVLVTIVPSVANVEVYLSPDMIDFRAKASVKVNDRPYNPPNGMLEPDIEVMLNDVRTRGDRLHPFWAMLDGR